MSSNLELFFVCFCFFAKRIIVGRLFRNIHPSLQYSSRSLINASFYIKKLGGGGAGGSHCTSCTMPLPLGHSVHSFRHFVLRLGEGMPESQVGNAGP